MLACNAVLVVMAVIAAGGWVWPALAASALTVALLLAVLGRRARAAIDPV